MKLLKPALIGMVSLAVSANTLAASFVYGDGGTALQTVLDDLTVKNPDYVSDPTDPDDINKTIPSSFDVTTDVMGRSGRWEITGSGNSGLTRIIGLASSNGSFGVYDVFDPSKRVELFGSSMYTNSLDNSSMMDTASLSIWADGSVMVNNLFDSGIDFASNHFGYYLDTGTNVFFSEQEKNQGDTDHMVAFQGNDLDYVKIGNHNPGIWTDSEYLFAWDVDGDKDFTDFVVKVNTVQVPEPSGLILCAIGLLGYGFSQRKVSEMV